MNKFSLLTPLVACISLVSCEVSTLTNDDNALQLLMGAPSKEIRSAIGTPMKQTGSLSNGTMIWYKNYTTPELVSTTIDTGLDSSSDVDILVDVEHYYNLEIKTSNDKIVSIAYGGDLPIVQDKWFYDKLVLMTVNHACASNDLQLLQSTLQEQPAIRTANIMAQAAAQAARYQSKEVLDYLIQTQKIDINAPLQTWVNTKIEDSNNLFLINTTIADIMKSAQ